MAYHNVFMPFTDVYMLGGADVFTRLPNPHNDKNAIVVPMPFVDRLEKEIENHHGSGARDALDFIRTQVRGADTRHVIEEGITRYTYTDGLDIILLDSPAMKPDRFSITQLESMIRDKIPCQEEQPTLLTTAARYLIKYQSRGLHIDEPEFLLAGPDVVQNGVIEGNEELLRMLYANPGRKVEMARAADLLGKDELSCHQFVSFKGGNVFGVVEGDYRYNRHRTRIVGVSKLRLKLLDDQLRNKVDSRSVRMQDGKINSVLGVQPRDVMQYLAFEHALLDEDVRMVFIGGGAGSGKTILSYAAAIDQVLHYSKHERQRRWGKEDKGALYERVVLLKAFEILGGSRRDVGYLPGSLFEKIEKQLESYEDAHKLSNLHGVAFEEMFLHPKYGGKFGKSRAGDSCPIDQANFNPRSEVVELTYSGFLRGRSFENVIVLVDEAQSFTPFEMKSILSRMGMGCKVVVMGDPTAQVDNPYCTPGINGFTHAVRHYLDEPYSCVVPLSTVHRSQIAEDANQWHAYQ